MSVTRKRAASDAGESGRRVSEVKGITGSQITVPET